MRARAVPTVAPDAIGWVTAEQMVEVDRTMIEDLHIDLLQMMENAGRSLARLVLDLAAPQLVAVAVGPGGNGGGGMVAARHLANAGVDVIITAVRSGADLSGVPAHQYDIMRRMGVAICDAVVDADVAIDAVLGYSLRGAPRGRAAEVIAQLVGGPPVVALDTPSGLDVTTGAVPGVAVTAEATLTLALPNTGLRHAPRVGALYVAHISVPRSVTATLGPAPLDFSRSPILRIR